MLTEAQLAYAAGIIDGEGHISVDWRRNGAAVVRLRVKNTDVRLMVLFKEWFGGYVWTEKTPRKGYKVRYSWQLASRGAAAALQALSPYLVLKKEQADIALAVSATAGKRGPKVPAAVVAARWELVGRLRLLTKKGVA